MDQPPPEAPPTDDFQVAPARYCAECGHDLSDSDNWLPPVAPNPGEPAAPRCPRCLKHFDPNDASTFRDTPKPAAATSWRDGDRLALVALFVLYLFGALVLNGLAADYGTGNNHVLGALALGLSVPWLIGCVYLALAALGNKLNPILTTTIPLATALGVLFALGSPTLILGAAFLLGPFTGLLFVWRNTD